MAIKFEMVFQNSCNSQFQTNSGSYVTTSDTVAGRVAEVLEIFPHIEYRPLAMLSAIQDNPFAYTNIIQDENDVDDISITSVNNGQIYRLSIDLT